MGKHARRSAGDGAPRRGLFERVMFSFMGPPQLGDLDAPVREVPPRPAQLCGSCGEPLDDHEIVRDPGLTYSRCRPPGQRPGAG